MLLRGFGVASRSFAEAASHTSSELPATRISSIWTHSRPWRSSLEGGAIYVLQQFRTDTTLLEEASVRTPYPATTLLDAASRCSTMDTDRHERRVSPRMRLPITRLDRELPLPRYAHDGDAGLDLFSAEDVVLKPFARSLIPTGIAVAIPEGYAGFVQPRSGLAIKQGLSLVNTPGLIDSHYRGEIKIIAINLDPDSDISLKRGDKIAQLVIQPVARVQLLEVDELDSTARGEGGFGSTGV